jgi:hypothetical protein
VSYALSRGREGAELKSLLAQAKFYSKGWPFTIFPDSLAIIVGIISS